MKPTHSPSASITHGEETIDLGKIREKRDKRAKRVKKNQKTGKKGGGGAKTGKAKYSPPGVCVSSVIPRKRGPRLSFQRAGGFRALSDGDDDEDDLDDEHRGQTSLHVPPRAVRPDTRGAVGRPFWVSPRLKKKQKRGNPYTARLLRRGREAPSGCRVWWWGWYFDRDIPRTSPPTIGASHRPFVFSSSRYRFPIPWQHTPGNSRDDGPGGTCWIHTQAGDPHT